MATTIFPTAADVAASAGDGNLLGELTMTPWAAGLHAWSGYTLSGSAATTSANLNLTIPLGVHLVNGYRVNKDASEVLAITASSTRYVGLQLQRTSGKVTGASYIQQASAVFDSDTIPLYRCTTSGAAITEVVDIRRWGPVPSFARAYRNAAEDHNSGTNTYDNPTFDTESLDIGPPALSGMFAPSSTTMTIRRAGYYTLSGGVSFAANGTGLRAMTLQYTPLGGAVTNAAAEQRVTAGAGGPTRMSLSADIPVLLLPGSTVNVAALQASGGNLAFEVGTGVTWMACKLIAEPSWT